MQILIKFTKNEPLEALIFISSKMPNKGVRNASFSENFSYILNE